MSHSEMAMRLRDRLVALPGVVTRKMFGTEAYFVGPAMFAFFTSTSVVLRLPHSAFAEAVAVGLARPFLSLGAAIGGLIAAVTARRFRVETIHGPRASREQRWVLAGAGGILAGLGAQVARGCTSGQALTGGAQLALGSWIFMFSVFGGAYALAWFVRKQWI